MDLTEEFHVQIPLLLQLTIPFSSLLLDAPQHPAVNHLRGRRTEDFHVFHEAYLVQTRKGHFFFVSTALGLAGAILGPFCPTQDCDNGLAAPGVLLELKQEVPVALKLSFQVTDFLF